MCISKHVLVKIDLGIYSTGTQRVKEIHLYLSESVFDFQESEDALLKILLKDNARIETFFTVMHR